MAPQAMTSGPGLGMSMMPDCTPCTTIAKIMAAQRPPKSATATTVVHAAMRPSVSAPVRDGLAFTMEAMRERSSRARLSVK